MALSDALIMVLREGKPADPVLTMYSDERRQVFQFFIDPVSSWVRNLQQLFSNTLDKSLMILMHIYRASLGSSLERLMTGSFDA